MSHNLQNLMKIEHIGVVVSDIPKALRTYSDLFGYKLLSGPFEDHLQQAQICFIGNSTDDPFRIEIIAPLGEGSHLQRLLEKGAGAYHICYEVQDIEKTLSHMRDKGCLVVREPVPAVAYKGRKIAWFFTPTRQLVELVER